MSDVLWFYARQHTKRGMTATGCTLRAGRADLNARVGSVEHDARAGRANW